MYQRINELQKRYALTLMDSQSDSTSSWAGGRSDMLFVRVSQEQAVSLLTELQSLEGFTHLVLFTAVDFIEEGNFQLTYILQNFEKHQDLAVLVTIDRSHPTMESIHHLWPHAMTYQQEMFEMYGIEFPGSPRLYDDFVLEGWDGPPPMLRDFDTKAYSEETFFPRPGRKTYDTTEYMKEKPYPSEAETW